MQIALLMQPVKTTNACARQGLREMEKLVKVWQAEIQCSSLIFSSHDKEKSKYLSKKQEKETL